MEQVISKEEFNHYMAIKGETIGMAIIEYKEFILKDKGKKGLDKLEKTMAEIGYPQYKKIKPMKFYPLGLYALTLIAIERLFHFDDEKFQKMGRFNAKLSMIIRFFMKFFVSLERVAKVVPRMWRRYYTVGDLKTVEYDVKKKYALLRLEKFKLHPLHCQVCKGYFSTILGIIVGSPVICQETKCVHRNDEYHQFLLKW